MSQQVRLEYGDSWLDVDLPESATVIRPGETWSEPIPLDDPVEATQQAIANPLDSPPLGDLVGPGSKVTIAFPDRVKGGNQATAHRRVAVSLLLDELARCGVSERDSTLICAIGLHRKNSRNEIAEYLGSEIVDRFRGERLINHDPEDPDGIVDAGETARGDVTEVNRHIVESDLAIMLGHVQGNPYGGYSGGYKMPCTGLTTWRSIRCHHTPGTMYRDDFVPISHASHFRHQLTDIGEQIESAMKHPFFTVDAVLDSQARQLAVFAGSVKAVEQASWPIAAQRTEREVAGEKADVLVIGMPRSFHYGPGMGSNPILMLQAIGASVARAAGALNPGAVVICASVCDGWFNDDWFPPYHEVYDLYQRCSRPEEMDRFEDDLANRPDYIHKFRYAYGYHPYHAFSMLYMGGIALRQSRAIYIVGAKAPGYARGMGCIPVATFNDALDHARRYVGADPKMLVVPELSKPQVHLRAAG